MMPNRVDTFFFFFLIVIIVNLKVSCQIFTLIWVLYCRHMGNYWVTARSDLVHVQFEELRES